jgi:hypothetical protein
VEVKRVLKYIEDLNFNRRLPKGEQYKDIVDRVKEMDAIPCYIIVFQLYTECLLWKKNRMEKSLTDYEAFMCYAYMVWYRAIDKHNSVSKNIKKEVK